MELRQLKYFVEVAKQEHVSIAAEKLHIAQSAVSRQIGNLEAELGVQLLQREGRNIKLTHIGKLFAEQAIIALKAMENAKQLVNEYIDPEKGIIRIGFPSSLASNILPQIISAFKKEHPDVSYQLRQGSYRFLMDGIKKREIDLAFIGPVPRNNTEIHADVLFTENFVALVPENHHLADQRNVSLYQLLNDSFVLFPQGFILRKIVEEACAQAGFKPSVVCEGEDYDAIKGLVKAGIGITIVPALLLNENQPSETISLKIREPELRRTVGILTPKYRELSPSELLFYDFVKKYFDSLTKHQ